MNDDSDYLMLSGIKQYCFCKRRWALIYVEQQWQENALTLDGHYMHERVHDAAASEKRGGLILARGMAVQSHQLRISGICDLVELIEDDVHGVPIHGRSGAYRLYPVEYKRGRPDASGADEWLLCAQAMCLEEMLCTEIPEGALYYGELRRRKSVVFTRQMKEGVAAAVSEMNAWLERRYTPRVKPKKACANCSLHEICQPNLPCVAAASEYVRKALWEDDA